MYKPSLALLALLVASAPLACRNTQASESERAAPPPSSATASPEVAPNIPAHLVESDAAAPDAEAKDAALEDATLAMSLDAGEDADAAADGGEDAGAPPAACPDDMIHIGRYCVDRWEAHLVTVGENGVETPWPHNKRLEKGMRYVAKSSTGAFPQGYISRVESAAACEGAGKRLCSRAEWTRACKGKKGFRYPYGNKGRSGACNTGKLHLLEKFFGRSRNAWTYEVFNDPKLDVEPGFLAESGAYPTCQSDEGVFDMVGNLHEWVSDKVADDILEILEKDQVERKKQPWKVGNGIFMGGFFSTTIEHGPGCMFITIAHEPKYHDYSTGFRCCKDAAGIEPKKTDKGRKKKKKT
jgi:hypothetical protein